MKIYYYLIILGVFASCSRNKVLSPEEYVKYASSSESGLKVEKEFNLVRYKLQLQTAEFLSIINSQGKTTDEFNSNFSYYRSKINFVFQLEDMPNSYKVKEAVFNREKYGAMLAYANTELNKDFTIVHGTDTILCALAHMESANSIQPRFRMVLGFSDLDTVKKDLTLIYNDNIFNNGPLKFHFPKKIFENMPEVKI